jgi:hypothetical protein
MLVLGNDNRRAVHGARVIHRGSHLLGMTLLIPVMARGPADPTLLLCCVRSAAHSALSEIANVFTFSEMSSVNSQSGI